MKNIFERFVNPDTIDEPIFTQIIASVLEKDHHLTKFLFEIIFSRKGIILDLSDTDIIVKDEKLIPAGGKPDIIVEFRKKGKIYASVIFENKIDAKIDNPLDAYIDEVAQRNKRGEHSLLLIVSKRNAREDLQLKELLSHNDFLYLSWHDIFILLKTELIATQKATWLLNDFYNYLKLMGVDMSGKFMFGEIGIGEYLPKLINKFDKIIDEDKVTSSLRQLSIQVKNPLKEWKTSCFYGNFTYVKPNTVYYVAAGFAFTRDHIWQDVNVNNFTQENCPIVISVGLGVEDSPDPDLSNWVKSLINEKNIKVPKLFVVNDPNSEFYLLAYKPLTDFLTSDDHLEACRNYLIERLNELKFILD